MMRSVEDAVSSVLAAAHPRVDCASAARSRRSSSVLEDDCGAYDIDDLQSVLETGFDTVVAKLEQRRRFSASSSTMWLPESTLLWP